MLSPALVGIPVLAYGVGEILAWSHGVELTGPTTARRLAGGWSATLLLAGAVVLGGIAGVCMFDGVEAAAGDDDPAIAIVVIVAPLVAGLLFAPLGLVPSLALAPAPRPPLLVGAVWLAAHRGAARTALLGLALGSLGALPFALAVLVAMLDDDLVPLALLAGVGMDVLLAGAALGAVARASERAREASEDASRHPAALSSLGRMSLVPLAVLGCVVALAASVPLMLVRGPALLPGPGVQIEEDERYRVPGTEIAVRPTWRYVEVWADDELRRYRYGGYAIDYAIDVRRGTLGGREIIELVMHSDWSGTRTLRLDAQGRRLGDGAIDRIAERAPVPVVLLLFVACVLGVAFALLVGREQARVRAIARVVAGGEGGDLVRGELRVRGAPVLAQGGTIRGAGGAWIEGEGGSLRIALPDAPTEALAIDPELPRELPEGTPFVLLTHGARLGGVGMRDASTPWPEGALAVVGDPQRAAASRVRAIFPAVVGLGIAIGVLLVIASLALAAAIP